MDVGHYVMAGFIIGEAVAIAFLMTPWLQKKILMRAIRLAKYSKEEAMEIVDEVKNVWG